MWHNAISNQSVTLAAKQDVAMTEYKEQKETSNYIRGSRWGRGPDPSEKSQKYRGP